MLKEGICEQIIYEDLKNQLIKLDSDKYLFQKEPIDVGEARTQLSSYISSVVKKCLRFIRENNKQNDTKANLISKLKYFHGDTGKKPTLINFLEHYNYTLNDVYGKGGDRSFSRMMVDAGIMKEFKNKDEVIMTKRLKNLFHINSRNLIEFATKVLTYGVKMQDSQFNKEEKRMLGMIYYSFYLEAPEKLGFSSFEKALATLCQDNKLIIEEAIEILQYNYLHIDFVDKYIDLGAICPIDLHCSYSTNQIMAALGYFNETKKPLFQIGVMNFNEMKLDAFFITLNKSNKDYSPSTKTPLDDFSIKGLNVKVMD